MAVSASHSKTILKLYKEILKHANVFPSVKRKKIILEIKFEFRNNKHLTDPKEIKSRVDLAVKGLGQLAMYSTLPKDSSKWEINLDTNAFPEPEKDK